MVVRRRPDYDLPVPRDGASFGAEECGGRAVVLAEKWKRLIPRVRGILDSLSGHNTD